MTSTTKDDPPRELESEFTTLFRFISSQPDTPMDPQRIVQVAAHAVRHAQSCAITRTLGSAAPHTIAATDDLPVVVDRIQYETREGPCLDALDSDDAELVNDLAADTRWPQFSARCTAETPVRSMLSVRLRLDGDDRAAMNFYSDQTGMFTTLDLATASVLAPFVAMSVQSDLNETRVGQLETALHTSRQIGTSMGILMARHLVTSDEAFDLLRRASQQLNRKLRDIAADVELTGSLPEMRAEAKRGDRPTPDQPSSDA